MEGNSLPIRWETGVKDGARIWFGHCPICKAHFVRYRLLDLDPGRNNPQYALEMDQAYTKTTAGLWERTNAKGGQRFGRRSREYRHEPREFRYGERVAGAPMHAPYNPPSGMPWGALSIADPGDITVCRCRAKVRLQLPLTTFA
jgi:hypothetical protein